MTTQLIAGATRGSGLENGMTLWDRAVAFSVRRLIHTQSWDDPEADLAALQLPLGSTIVTVSSGGCNALSYLTAQPAQIFAVDRSESQLALLKLRLAGVRAFGSYDEFWEFFGEAASPANAERYLQKLRPLLDAPTRSYWDGHNVLGRRRYTYFTDGLYRHGLLGRAIGFAHQITRVLGIDLDVLLMEAVDSPARLEAMARLGRLFHSTPLRLVARAQALLFSLGISPQQRALLQAEAPLDVVLYRRLLRLIDGHPADSNYFAWQALRRAYSGPDDRCLPPYLQRRHFPRMRNGVGVIIPVRANLAQFLDSLPAREVDAVALLDVQDSMGVDDIRKLWTAIDRAGSERIRVVCRTTGSASPLEAVTLSGLRGRWQRDEERSAVGAELDRSGIYGGFHCYVRCA
ncbi:S-adenosylmethionine:diacylglycerol 3-amino-3-carboxypropyl transferase [Bradyrhizobium sp. STM 3843]|uniref:DUF3419 family protein n=1 Tax=Bradyrhizobium sp. STM 3843 TaxID=551947 RepID=UPI000240349A|nr:BtaA family protein [Bradyrhizobium sp. STM 3843]CCE11350.1 S-adenosylmethionine:diacylglycerol 3-amino-3-carboxypropyl transferase [Bradyrhizobium sp. STM 3843]